MLVSRRRVLMLGADALAAVALSKFSSGLSGMHMAASTAVAGLPSAAPITLADDFTTLGTREIIGRTILDSAGGSYTWTQLYPSPAWRRGPLFSTGDPGIVDGKLIRRHPTTAMYPGLPLPGVPAHVEVDFIFDVSGVGGRSVFIHLFADTDGTRTTSEIPFHLSIGEKGYAVKAMSTSAGDTDLTGFGDFPDTGSQPYDGGVKLAYGVKHTVLLDMVGNDVTISFPVAANTAPVTLTDARLTQARHPGGGDRRFLVLEDEADLANEPYNGFTGVRTILGSSGGATPPTVTAIIPAARGQGSTNQPVTVAGTGFADTAVVSIDGAGVTIKRTTFISSSEIQLIVSIAAYAAVGTRVLTVANPDGGTASASLTVTPRPQPMSASPSVARGSTQQVTVSGTNFVAGTGLKVQVVGAGISTGSPTTVSATAITVDVTVSASAAIGTYKVTVTNPDGGKGSRADCVTVT